MCCRPSVMILALFLLAFSALAMADSFGTSPNQFTIDFVDVGNAGNADDAGAGGGVCSSPFGGVGYNYRMSTYEVSQDMIAKATASGLTDVAAGPWSGNQPAANVNWFEAAAFVNWLNTSTGHQAAYDLTYDEGWTMELWDSAEAWQLDEENLYRHKDAYYFLPSEDEWYKAAYHQNNGVTADYWDYPTGSNDVPDGIDVEADPDFQAVFWEGYDLGAPNDIDNAGSAASAYRTYGQGGNVWEWTESSEEGVNSDWTRDRILRGCYWYGESPGLRADWRQDGDPWWEGVDVGFRVASVPEPGSITLIIVGGTCLLASAWRCRRS